MKSELINSIGLRLRRIERTDGSSSELDKAHPEALASAPGFVRFIDSFYIGIFAVTQCEYFRVTGINPSVFKDAANPIENIDWIDAMEFCIRLSAIPSEKLAGRVYRLPTEAEWEFACRANTKTAFSFGSCEDRLRDFAWFGDNSGVRGDVLSNSRRDITERVAARIFQRCRPHPVGQKRPNPWGLYDMHGNIWEWCCDSADIGDWNVNGKGINDPTGQRFLRGGSWLDSAWECRSASRTGSDPEERNFCYGFRVVMTVCDS